uniref:Uncharacterized protein n=1 Tax=Arundo donax TaxID=35708 RepID=A0A0A9H2N9_ARUDO
MLKAVKGQGQFMMWFREAFKTPTIFTMLSRIHNTLNQSQRCINWYEIKRESPVEHPRSLGPDEEDGEQDHKHLGHEGEQRVAWNAVEERPSRHHRGQQPAGHLLPPPQHHIRHCAHINSHTKP